jgi:hypothetical protein
MFVDLAYKKDVVEATVTTAADSILRKVQSATSSGKADADKKREAIGVLDNGFDVSRNTTSGWLLSASTGMASDTATIVAQYAAVPLGPVIRWLVGGVPVVGANLMDGFDNSTVTAIFYVLMLTSFSMTAVSAMGAFSVRNVFPFVAGLIFRALCMFRGAVFPTETEKIERFLAQEAAHVGDAAANRRAALLRIAATRATSMVGEARKGFVKLVEDGTTGTLVTGSARIETEHLWTQTIQVNGKDAELFKPATRGGASDPVGVGLVAVGPDGTRREFPLPAFSTAMVQTLQTKDDPDEMTATVEKFHATVTATHRLLFDTSVCTSEGGHTSVDAEKCVSREFIDVKVSLDLRGKKSSSSSTGSSTVAEPLTGAGTGAADVTGHRNSLQVSAQNVCKLDIGEVVLRMDAKTVREVFQRMKMMRDVDGIKGVVWTCEPSVVKYHDGNASSPIEMYSSIRCVAHVDKADRMTLIIVVESDPGVGLNENHRGTLFVSPHCRRITVVGKPGESLFDTKDFIELVEDLSTRHALLGGATVSSPYRSIGIPQFRVVGVTVGSARVSKGQYYLSDDGLSAERSVTITRGTDFTSKDSHEGDPGSPDSVSEEDVNATFVRIDQSETNTDAYDRVRSTEEEIECLKRKIQDAGTVTKRKVDAEMQLPRLLEEKTRLEVMQSSLQTANSSAVLAADLASALAEKGEVAGISDLVDAERDLDVDELKRLALDAVAERDPESRLRKTTAITNRINTGIGRIAKATNSTASSGLTRRCIIS